MDIARKRRISRSSTSNSLKGLKPRTSSQLNQQVTFEKENDVFLNESVKNESMKNDSKVTLNDSSFLTSLTEEKTCEDVKYLTARIETLKEQLDSVIEEKESERERLQLQLDLSAAENAELLKRLQRVLNWSKKADEESPGIMGMILNVMQDEDYDHCDDLDESENRADQSL